METETAIRSVFQLLTSPEFKGITSDDLSMCTLNPAQQKLLKSLGDRYADPLQITRSYREFALDRDAVLAGCVIADAVVYALLQNQKPRDARKISYECYRNIDVSAWASAYVRLLRAPDLAFGFSVIYRNCLDDLKSFANPVEECLDHLMQDYNIEWLDALGLYWYLSVQSSLRSPRRTKGNACVTKSVLHNLGRYVSGHVNELKNVRHPEVTYQDVVITIREPPGVHVRVEFDNRRE